MELTLNQRIFIVKKFYQSNNSAEIVQNEFPNIFRKCSISPTNEIILNLVNCFEKFGTIRKKRPEVKEKIVEIESEEPRSSPERCLIDDVCESEQVI